MALRPGSNSTPFDDEALYMFMGHRMIAHLLHGSVLFEHPGTFFSGAPGLYPVLAALGDDVDGVRGARLVSLVFAVGATVCVNGLGRALYGRRAGVLGAASFALCGSVLFLSYYATFDSTLMFLVAAAAWLTAYSVKHDDFRWSGIVALVLVLAFYVKYAGAAYAPIIAALAIAVAIDAGRNRALVVRRTVLMLLLGLAVGYFVFLLWGQSLGPGITSTTASRVAEEPATTSKLIHVVILWVGPWLLLAAVGAAIAWRRWAPSVVLLIGAIIGPLEQIRIGEQLSLNKHVAFGMVFAAPLIGLLMSELLDRIRYLTVPVVIAGFGCLGAIGLHYSHQFMTTWVPDTAVLPPLRAAVDAAPGRPILGELPEPERWALRSDTQPRQWSDTFAAPYLRYDGRTGVGAVDARIDQQYYGVIFLIKQRFDPANDRSPTPAGDGIYRYLSTGRTPYKLDTTVSRVNPQGVLVGRWYIFVPRGETVPTLATPGSS
ncbi:MAG TPA: glycosyltransferase family 39 protein [Mycobacteriales bacterium]|nr:glycosyltransferase family 39 protein [Mycobacteriales bacterium]